MSDTGSTRVEFRFPATGRFPTGHEKVEANSLAGEGTIERHGVLTVVQAVPEFKTLVERVVQSLNDRDRVMVKFGGSRKFSTAGRWFTRESSAFLSALKDYSLRSHAVALVFEESELGATSYGSVHPSEWPEF